MEEADASLTDAKETAVDAAVAALKAFLSGQRVFTLILPGFDKGLVNVEAHCDSLQDV